MRPFTLAVIPLLSLLATGARQTAPAEFRQTFDSMQDVEAAFTLSSWSNTNRTHSPANVTVEDGVLELKLSGSAPGTLPVCAEIASRRNDFHYGTYRAAIKMSKVPGAVVGWFTYLGRPLNEIDVEFLTREPRLARFTLHHVQTGVDHGRKEVAFDPSAAFHEYRFDWHKDRVDYFIDGEPAATLTKQIPDMPSRLMLNHWSGNIPTFGGPAPTEDAVMQVDWVYYSPDFTPPSGLTVSTR
jgi:beta-glucanase (GH16 family)